ncbi:putative uncharacterized protein DDB_G0271606 isoform X2 [Ptychodera flava]|uniref:putative uncharacterized protein DDB_G0271606 isoform X2 n=1 Tax=Ptychodera flava TaxID=63121 RepID=UPI00396AB057
MLVEGAVTHVFITALTSTSSYFTFHGTCIFFFRHLGLHLGDRFDFDEEGARHIYEHMSQIIDLPEAVKQGEFSDEQGQFYLFVSHDFDGNNKLDGLECFTMLTDFYDTKDPTEAGHLAGKMTLKEVEGLVDDLLVKHDTNRDGYLDFAELFAPNVQSVWTKMGEAIQKAEKLLDEAELGLAANQQQLGHANEAGSAGIPRTQHAPQGSSGHNQPMPQAIHQQQQVQQQAGHAQQQVPQQIQHQGQVLQQVPMQAAQQQATVVKQQGHVQHQTNQHSATLRQQQIHVQQNGQMQQQQLQQQQVQQQQIRQPIHQQQQQQHQNIQQQQQQQQQQAQQQILQQQQKQPIHMQQGQAHGLNSQQQPRQ